MTDWTPPPPGDTREQLPAEILALVDAPSYLSTACELAALLDAAADTHREQAPELAVWQERQHARCRINNKYTGKLCICGCHRDARL